MFAGAVLIAVLAILLDLLSGGIGLLAARRARPRRTTKNKTTASAATARA